MNRANSGTRQFVRRIGAFVAVVASCTVAAPAVAQSLPRLSPIKERLSDESIARDMRVFDSLETVSRGAVTGPAALLESLRAHVMGPGAEKWLRARHAAYVGLARDAYERNDAGALTTRLLAAGVGDSLAPRTRRPELWALFDSVTPPALMEPELRSSLVALESALIRSQSPILGAPNCAAWDIEADRLAVEVRMRLVPPPTVAVEVIVAPVPLAPVPAPVAPAPLRVPAELHGIPSMVHFALDKSFLAPASRRVLDVMVDSLRRFPDVQIVLEGHTDLRASAAYNLALSRRRTVSVQNYLIGKGIDVSRIRIVAQGKSHLEMVGTGVVDHARNRRVQLRYFAPDGREIPALSLLDDLQLETYRR